jgi:2-C-methyl-D-erythritol 4-phosphate cytidylyltransferase
MNKTQAIIAAGGTGTRLGGSKIKPLVELRGRPLIAYTLEIFTRSSLISGIICVAPPGFQEEFRKVLEAEKLNQTVKLIPGGATRAKSVAAMACRKASSGSPWASASAASAGGVLACGATRRRSA